MKRVWKHYKTWEDAKSGLYKTSGFDKITEQRLSKQAELLLKDQEMFSKEGFKMIESWENAAMANLSISSRNKQAWIGQATCCFVYGVPEYLTKLAWNNLTQIEKIEANLIANKIIDAWENSFHG